MCVFPSQEVFESRFAKTPDEPRPSAPGQPKKEKNERAGSPSSSESSDSESSLSESSSDSEEDEEMRTQRLSLLEEQVLPHIFVYTFVCVDIISFISKLATLLSIS